MNPVSKVVSLLHSSALSGYRNCVFHFGEKNPDQLVEILLIHFLVIVFYICFICRWTWVCFYLKSFQTFLFSCFHLLTITKFKLSAWYVATSATEPMPKINILLSQFSSFQWLMCIHFVFKWLYNWLLTSNLSVLWYYWRGEITWENFLCPLPCRKVITRLTLCFMSVTL